MQTLSIGYPATEPLPRPVHVGAVASGDLEIVMTAAAPGATVATVALRTSVDGFDTVWRRVLDRFFAESALIARYEINDFGATPGMVSLRLAQAREVASDPAEFVLEGGAR
ncbi:malonate decarboxylase acyl carrier protein [Pengzhenrongella sp.]|jgi:malonate decarboxylase acyl carrier protein|uniref:malonate decarboxylase acyl carrier protein n=1 Tax=Pengzhenrongella sp. TaxID=2888820 RepID=UPI002F93A838